MITVEEYLAKQDQELLKELLEYGGMVVTTCSCGYDLCEGYRLQHPDLRDLSDKIVWDKNGAVT